MLPMHTGTDRGAHLLKLMTIQRPSFLENRTDMDMAVERGKNGSFLHT